LELKLLTILELPTRQVQRRTLRIRSVNQLSNSEFLLACLQCLNVHRPLSAFKAGCVVCINDRSIISSSFAARRSPRRPQFQDASVTLAAPDADSFVIGPPRAESLFTVRLVMVRPLITRGHRLLDDGGSSTFLNCDNLGGWRWRRVGAIDGLISENRSETT